jgi:hypothetical protein
LKRAEDHHGKETQEGKIEEKQKSQTCQFGAQENAEEKRNEEGCEEDQGKEEGNDKQRGSACSRIERASRERDTTNGFWRSVRQR